MTGWQDEWPDDRLKGWQDDRMAEWPNDRMTGWQNDQMTKWPDDQMTRWLNDQMSGWPIDQMTRWPDDRKLRRWLTVWYIFISIAATRSPQWCWLCGAMERSTAIKISLTFNYWSCWLHRAAPLWHTLISAHLSISIKTFVCTVPDCRYIHSSCLLQLAFNHLYLW